MDVWLKSGFLIPCIRLMWLSRREGRGKLGLSSVQYLQKYSRKRSCKMTGSGAQGGQAGLAGRQRQNCFWLQRGESLEQAEWPSGWLGGAGYSPEKSSQQASQGGRQQQHIRVSVLALSYDCTLHSLVSGSRDPTAGLVVSLKEWPVLS